MKLLSIAIIFSNVLIGQVRFFPTPRAGDLIDQFFKEINNINMAKKNDFKVKIDDHAGKIEYKWKNKTNSITKYEYMKNIIRAELECELDGVVFPIVYSYKFKLEAPCRERMVFWKIESICNDTRRFELVGGKSIKINENGYEVYIRNGIHKSQNERYRYYFNGDVIKKDRFLSNSFSFCAKYKSYCLPCVVFSGMSGSREEMDASFDESDPEILTQVRSFLITKKQVDFLYEHRTTLGPGLDVEHSRKEEIVDELIKNIQLAKNNNWMTWGDDFEKLLQNIKDIKYVIQIKNRNILNQKIKSSYLSLNNVKNVGRREFFAMVNIYLATLEKKSD